MLNFEKLKSYSWRTLAFPHHGAEVSDIVVLTTVYPILNNITFCSFSLLATVVGGGGPLTFS